MIGLIDEVVFDCGDPARLAQFWAGVLGGEPPEDKEWCLVHDEVRVPPSSAR